MNGPFLREQVPWLIKQSGKNGLMTIHEIPSRHGSAWRRRTFAAQTGLLGLLRLSGLKARGRGIAQG